MNIYNEIYEKLCLLGFNFNSLPESGKSKSGGYMDLNFDYLSKNGDQIIIALHHRYELNGDLVPDPDMEIKVNLTEKQAEPLSYSDITDVESSTHPLVRSILRQKWS